MFYISYFKYYFDLITFYFIYSFDTWVYNLNTYALNLIDIFLQNTFYFIYSFDTWVKHQVPSKEFKLHFFFAQNPYLENTVVNKTNHMIEEDDSILEKAIIGWSISFLMYLPFFLLKKKIYSSLTIVQDGDWVLSYIECLDQKVLKISQRRDPKSQTHKSHH